jgi:hypothetical protein
MFMMVTKEQTGGIRERNSNSSSRNNNNNNYNNSIKEDDGRISQQRINALFPF